LDEPLARTGLTAFRREMVGVRGRKKHRKVSPFHYRATEKEPPTTLVMTTEDGRHLLADVHSGDVARPLRQLVVRANGERTCVPFPVEWSAEDLAFALRNKGLEEPVLEEIHLETGEDGRSPELTTLIRAVFGPFEADVFLPGEQAIQSQLHLKALVSDAYFRAIAKVALHYTLWAVPGLTGHEPPLEALKDYIRWGAGETTHFVQPVATQMMADLNRCQLPTATHHLLMAYIHERGASAAVRFFVNSRFALPPSLVELSRGRHFEKTFVCGHFITLYGDRLDGYDGEVTVAPIALCG
jgi:hypothetical protein